MNQEQFLNKPAVMATWSAAFFTKLHRYRALLKRRWWVLLLAISLCLLYQAGKIWRLPPSYFSSARMMVAPRMLIPDKATYTEELSNFFGTQIKLMESGEVKNRAVNRVKATRPELAPSAVGLQVFQEPRTAIFVLNATGGEGVYTEAFLNAAMEEFIRFKDEMREQTSDQTLSTLMEQLVKLERELEQSQQALFDFQKNNDVVILREQGNTAGEYVVKLEKEMADKRKEFQLLELILNEGGDENALPKMDANDSFDAASELFTEGPEAEYQKIKQEIQFLRSQVVELSVDLKPTHPKLVKMREDIARGEQLLDISKAQGITKLKARRDSLKIEMANSERVLREWESKALSANQRMVEYDRLKANMERIKSTYEQLLSTVQNINVSSNINQTSISILEYASPAVSIKPGLAKSLSIAIVLGLLLGGGVLFLLDRIDDRINSFTELKEYFDEQVLGQIPLEALPGKNRVPLLSDQDERQVYAEAFRNIRSSLLYMPIEGRRPKTLLVTSAIPGEGKSTVAGNLAATLAFADSKVLLIDADLRKGLIHEDLGLESAPGLSDVLAQKMSWKEVVLKSGIENLHFIPRGKTSNRVGELLLGSVTNLIIREVQDAYDYVVFDSPPIMATDDTPSLAPKMDGVLMVMRASFTSSRLTQNSLDNLYQRQVNVLGMIFNCIDTNLPDYYHYNYYKYYYTSS